MLTGGARTIGDSWSRRSPAYGCRGMWVRRKRRKCPRVSTAVHVVLAFALRKPTRAETHHARLSHLVLHLLLPLATRVIAMIWFSCATHRNRDRSGPSSTSRSLRCHILQLLDFAHPVELHLDLVPWSAGAYNAESFPALLILAPRKDIARSSYSRDSGCFSTPPLSVIVVSPARLTTLLVALESLHRTVSESAGNLERRISGSAHGAVGSGCRACATAAMTLVAKETHSSEPTRHHITRIFTLTALTRRQRWYTLQRADANFSGSSYSSARLPVRELYRYPSCWSTRCAMPTMIQASLRNVSTLFCSACQAQIASFLRRLSPLVRGVLVSDCHIDLGRDFLVEVDNADVDPPRRTLMRAASIVTGRLESGRSARRAARTS
ncbi:hypothetical protein EXIGLDRAFT_28835 [Exidia glandulosa HHB12029]|uniref:Uncharacterized protein n=1 Tax=Exidia glandulosa HHB12029 TaxID=1314781 RepID=A0A165P9U2_EXIGL|nr:hypothetical protein EXIGLDRAFT_28835 [Exidia glandulosa HHB12029]